MTTDPLAYPLTGEPMTLEPGKTYVLRSLRHLDPYDLDRIRAHGDNLGVKFVVLDESLEIVADNESSTSPDPASSTATDTPSALREKTK